MDCDEIFHKVKETKKKVRSSRNVSVDTQTSLGNVRMMSVSSLVTSFTAAVPFFLDRRSFQLHVSWEFSKPCLGYCFNFMSHSGRSWRQPIAVISAPPVQNTTLHCFYGLEPPLLPPRFGVRKIPRRPRPTGLVESRDAGQFQVRSTRNIF